MKEMGGGDHMDVRGKHLKSELTAKARGQPLGCSGAGKRSSDLRPEQLKWEE